MEPGQSPWVEKGLALLFSHFRALPALWLLGRFPTPVLPVVSQWKDMMGTAFSLAIVGYVINLAMGRTLASKHGYDVDSNQVGPATYRAKQDGPRPTEAWRQVLWGSWGCGEQGACR